MLVPFLLAVCGCSSGSGGGGDRDAADADAADQAGDTDAAEGLVCTPNTGEPETEVSQDSLFAGELLTVTCSFAGCPAWEGDGLEFAVGGTAEEDWSKGGHDVTFTRPGQYEVACRYTADGKTVSDSTPAIVEVLPGIPERVETILDKKELTAGTQVPVTCQAFDAYDNEVFGTFSLATDPQVGISSAGTTLLPEEVGEYQVACVLDGVHVSQAPVTVTVIPNVPVLLNTILSNNTMTAGKTVTITCEALDHWDNKVKGFPMVVALPPDLSLSGLSITGTKVGLYEVKCVPQALDWALFTLKSALLTVVPDKPVLIKLTVVPDKPTYKVLDKVLIQAAVKDSFDNLVPDAKFKPIDIVPPAGVTELPGWNFKLTEEGVHDFVVTLESDPGVNAKVTLVVDGSGPLLSVDFPERGATLNDKPSVTVTGSVSDQVTGLASFTINDQDVEVGLDNAFSQIVIPNHAVNLLTAAAVDQGGESTKTTRAFAWSGKYYAAEGSDAETHVPDGVAIYLDETFVDDGDHNAAQPDDLATLMELALGNLDFGSLIPNPVYNANNYQVFVKNVSLQSPKVNMDLIEGGMTINATFQDLQADVDAIGSCKVIIIDLCPDVSGKLHADAISLYASLQISLDANGDPTATVTQLQLGVDGMGLDLSGLGSLLQPIMDAIMGIFQKQIEESLAAQLSQMLPALIADVFSQFELDQNITVPPLVQGGKETTVNLTTKYSKLAFSPDGIEMAFDARAYAPKQVVHSPLGSLGRGDCAGDEPPFAIDTTSEVAFAMFDDLLNQVLFAVWWGGALNLTLTEQDLGSVLDTLGTYGITEPIINLDFFLAPMFTECNPASMLRFGVGDLYIQADVKLLDVPVSMGLFATAMGNASIALVNDGGKNTFSFTIESIDTFAYEIVSISEGWEDLVPLIEELLAGETLQNALASIAGQSFGGMELPEIDLTGLVPGVPAGTKISISPQKLVRQSGHTELTGEIK